MSTVLAQMHWGVDHMDAWWGAWMWIGMAVIWLIALGIVAWAVTKVTSTSHQRRSTLAEDVLAERFARGEIKADEYRERLEELRR